MRFEGEPKGEGAKEEHIVERIEQGELSEEERATLRDLKEAALRYGMPLKVGNFDGRTGEQLDFKENADRMFDQVFRRIQHLQQVASREAFRTASQDDRLNFVDHALMSPEELAREGKDESSLGEFLNVPSVPFMEQEELDTLKEIDDALEADRIMQGNFHPYTGEDLRKLPRSTDAQMEKRMEITTEITHRREAFQEGMAAQMEHPGLIAYTSEHTPEEYVAIVKKKLDQFGKQ